LAFKKVLNLVNLPQFAGLGNLSTKKQTSRQDFSSKSRQVTGQDFLKDEFKTEKQNRALRR